MDLTKQMNDLVAAKLEEGILDENFVRWWVLPKDDNPAFAEELIKVFIDNADPIVYTNLPKALALQGRSRSKFVNFCHVSDHAISLIGSSSSIGGIKVAETCREMLAAARPEVMDKESCLQAFEKLKDDYETLRQCLNELAEIAKGHRVYEFSRKML